VATGTYVHADGTDCHHGIPAGELSRVDAYTELDRMRITLLPRPRCHDGQLITRFRVTDTGDTPRGAAR
jgi:hypothetical protein